MIQRRWLWGMMAALLCLPTGQAAAQTPTPSPYRVVAYYHYYDIYPENGTRLVWDIPVETITHLHYANIGISEAGQCISVDEYADTEYLYPGDRPVERLRGNFKQLPTLRQRNPNLQIIMVVGGWDNSHTFSTVAASAEGRERFAESCIAFMQEYGFDGIEIDWRYPVEGGRAGNAVSDADSANLTLLIETLRGALDAASIDDDRRYLLTMQLPGVQAQYRHFEIENLHPLLDYLNLVSFGFEGSWSTMAAHIAPLYASTRDPRETEREAHSVDGAVRAYLNRGVPAQKIVVGVPFYGQAWQNVSPNDLFGLYQETGGIPNGTRAGGTLYYRDLAPFLASSDYVRYFDDLALVPWMYNARRGIAISYENPESIRNKAAYVRSMGLGGLMGWALSYDSQDHRLLNAMYAGLTLP
ncbi:MAG: glycoside hydrolase family 18 protein [bacterium]|nr:glycoside hydrolase family 18 protein [bacterium]